MTIRIRRAGAWSGLVEQDAVAAASLCSLPRRPRGRAVIGGAARPTRALQRPARGAAQQRDRQVDRAADQEAAPRPPPYWRFSCWVRLVSSLDPDRRSQRRARAATPMKTFTSGCTIVRNACGRITNRSDWVNVKPIERAASACPTGTVLIPPRTASQTNAAPNSAMHRRGRGEQRERHPDVGQPEDDQDQQRQQRACCGRTRRRPAPTPRSGAIGADPEDGEHGAEHQRPDEAQHRQLERDQQPASRNRGCR